MSSPLISVMIPAYNRSQLLRQTLASVMQQCPDEGWLEVCVVDDCSQHEPPDAIVESIPSPHLRLIKNSQNIGQIPNLNRCIELAKGEWVHLLHSDDVVLPGFYNAMREAISQFPEAGAIFCRHAFIEEDGTIRRLSEPWTKKPGIIPQWKEKIATFQCIQTPSIIVKRDVYSHLGHFRTDLQGCEDWEMWHRISQQYKVLFLPEVLCQYRESSLSNSGDAYLSGRYITDLQTAIQILYNQHRQPVWYTRSINVYGKFIIDKFFEIQANSSLPFFQLIRWWRIWMTSIFFSWKKVPAMFKLSARVLFGRKNQSLKPE